MRSNSQGAILAFPRARSLPFQVHLKGCYEIFTALTIVSSREGTRVVMPCVSAKALIMAQHLSLTSQLARHTMHLDFAHETLSWTEVCPVSCTSWQRHTEG